MKNQTKSSDYANEIQKAVEEKEELLKNKEALMHILATENAELKSKLSQEENYKAKLNKIEKKKKEKINNLKGQLKDFQGAVDSSKNNSKWNMDLVSQRDNQIKVLKEKLKKKEERRRSFEGKQGK